MLIDDARTQARRYARVSSTQSSDAQLNKLMQDSIDEFATDVDGFPMEEYLSIGAKFDTKTNFAIRITITGGTNALAATDVALTTTARTGTTGTIVASDFQATLRTAIGGGANATVVWANFAFTVDTIDGTAITFAAPTTVTNVDARDLLGLDGTTTEAGADVTGAFPQDCTMEATIPSAALTVEQVEWDQNKLMELPRGYFISPEVSGSPAYYNVRGREIRVLPSPTTQELFHIEYRGAPTATVFQGYQELGLTGVSDESSSGLSAQAYKVGLSINGATSADITTTIGADDTWAAVIILLNAQTTGATWAVVGGDIRLTSDAVTGVSSIAIVEGQTAGMLAGITGFTAVDTAVAGDTALPTEIPGTFHQYIPHLVASKLLEETHEKMSDKEYMKYLQGVNKYKSDYHRRNTQIALGYPVARLPKVSM